ncbi:putative GAL4-like Zn(II)2Cys6 (or C6 zinc) binuclear cluster DNA-binding domain [Lyophyllum shimeji]|uniref:GAL4-like Zn(II)2Cys6 (Or C6 zinc) binuclear cluster DNA-binding domain n=1 Tax=Lyophyllum shimeji TaxID=47721 RepID=A0A9P3PQK9_LYOSH|nr:putative GAL4-like Zn(II)2Cys6 (or C6 zinc) binuclear cluster DNA-binding domain [Lyophyllum shimeji]
MLTTTAASKSSQHLRVSTSRRENDHFEGLSVPILLYAVEAVTDKRPSTFVSDVLPFMTTSMTKTAAAPLQRGKACSNCRRRKIRCDGRHPTCGPCERTSKADDCEYADSGRSRVQGLEATISRLAARVRELERENNSSSVPLIEPYEGSGQSPPISIRLSSPGSSPDSSNSSPQVTPANLTESSCSATPSSASSSTDVQQEEPRLPVSKLLLQTFQPHASEFGFFLDFTRFYDSAVLPLPIGHHLRPCRALLSAVYLWGVHLSQSETLSSREHIFLERALRHAANNLSSNHPQKILHGIQAEVLLCLYFFQTGRFLEGRVHCSSAISMVFSTGMHKIRSMNRVNVPPYIALGEPITMLPPPESAVEEGERILGFWTVYALHNCWGVALGFPMTLPSEFPGSQIDTPWPLELNQYEQFPSELQGSFTVRKFLDDAVENSYGEFSTLSMYCKASILYESAARHAMLAQADMQPGDATRFTQSFATLNECIDRFISALPNITHLEMVMPDAIRTNFVTHTLAHAASSRLNAIFAETNEQSREKSLAAALCIVGLIKEVDIQNFQHINPIIGTLWMSACQVMTCEVARLRTVRTIFAPESFADEKEDQLMAAIERCFGAMAMFSLDCPLIGYQLTQVQQKYSRLT